jgi:hypothetical protein
MTTNIPALQGTTIKHCLLVDIILNDTTYYLSNASIPLTYSGHVYSQLGSFMGMSEVQDDLKATNNQISIQLTGLPTGDGAPSYMSIALNSNLKGSKILIRRAFFNGAGNYDPTQVYLRFDGYVSNFSLNENWDQDNKITTNTISLQCSNVHAILEKKYSGRRTNETDQQFWYPGDISMYRVKVLSDTQFDFGKPYVATSSGGGGGGGGYYDEQGNFIPQ